MLEPPGEQPWCAGAKGRAEAQGWAHGEGSAQLCSHTPAARAPLSKTRFMCTSYSLRFIFRDRICPALSCSPKCPHHTAAPGRSAPAASHRRTQRCRLLEGDPAVTPGISARRGTTLLTPGTGGLLLSGTAAVLAEQSPLRMRRGCWNQPQQLERGMCGCCPCEGGAPQRPRSTPGTRIPPTDTERAAKPRQREHTARGTVARRMRTIWHNKAASSSFQYD